MSEQIEPLFSAVEDNCKDSILSARKLFHTQQGKGVPEFYETLKLKLNTKINYEYSNVAKTDELAT